MLKTSQIIRVWLGFSLVLILESTISFKSSLGFNQISSRQEISLIPDHIKKEDVV